MHRLQLNRIVAFTRQRKVDGKLNNKNVRLVLMLSFQFIIIWSYEADLVVP